MVHHILGPLAFAALLSGCAVERSEQQPSNSAVIETATIDHADEAERVGIRYGHNEADAPEGLDACRLLPHVAHSLDTLRRWPHTIVAGGIDSCVLALLDSLGNRFVESGDTIFLEVLDSLHAVDDGYVAEYVPEVAAHVARSRFAEYFEYLFNRRDASPPMEHALVEGIIGSSVDGDARRGASAWRSTIREALPAASIDPMRREYLDTLLRRAGIR